MTSSRLFCQYVHRKKYVEQIKQLELLRIYLDKVSHQHINDLKFVFSELISLEARIQILKDRKPENNPEPGHSKKRRKFQKRSPAKNYTSLNEGGDPVKASEKESSDDNSFTLDDLKSGWQGDALLLSDDLDTLSEMVQAKTGKTQKKRLLEAAKVPAASPSTPRRAFEKGDKVRAAQFRDPGIVLSKADSKGNVECQFGLVKAKIPSHLLELKSVAAASTPSTNKKISNQTFPVVKAQKLSATSSQRMDMGLDTVLPHKGNTLDVRGALVDTALDKVDEFLDKCWRQDISPLVIVHGHGTGKVKQGVREYLNTCGYKLRWRPGTSGEGADGATIVQLED